MRERSPILPRCQGDPTPEYARLGALIYDLATEDLDDDRRHTLERLTGMHFLLDAVRDSFKLAMNTAADPDPKHPGRVSFRDQAAHLGLSQPTISKYIYEARDLIESEEYDLSLQKARHPVAA